MKLPAVEPVIKASRLAVAAKRNNWHGKFTSPEPEDGGQRVTTLSVTRNDESLEIVYYDNAYGYGEYKLFDESKNVHCASVGLEHLTGWPDLVDLIKKYPTQGPKLVDIYRRMPFDESMPDQQLMESLYGRTISWYSAERTKIFSDTVLAPRKDKAKQYRIAPVGHRKLFHFIGAAAGFRSVLIDTIIQVS